MQEHARIQIARSRAHHDPAGRREAHGRVDAHALANGGEAGAVPQVGDDDPSQRRSGVNRAATPGG